MKRQMWLWWMVAVVVSLASVRPAGADLLKMDVTKDSANNYRGWNSHYYGTGSLSPYAQIYLYADLLSQIPAAPAGKTIQIDAATVNYDVYTVWDVPQSSPFTVQAFRISGNYSTMSEGPAVTDDSAGWDMTTQPPAVAEGYGTYSNPPDSQQGTGWFALDIKDLVQKWADGTYSNEGVMVNHVGSYYSQGVLFREGGTSPFFNIEYSYVPEPATIGLLCLGGLGLLRKKNFGF